VQMQISDSRLRDGNKAKFVGLLAKVPRHQRVDHVILDLCREALADDGGGYVPTPETRKPSQFLIFLNQRLGLAGHLLGWNLDLDLALCVALGFGGAHCAFQLCGDFGSSTIQGSDCNRTTTNLSVKTEGDSVKRKRAIDASNLIHRGPNWTERPASV